MNVWTHLAPLTQLTELELINFIIDLGCQAPTQPIPSVRVLRLACISPCGALCGESAYDASVFRIFQHMFPNVSELYTLKIR